MFQVQPGVLQIQAFGSQFGTAEAGNVGAKLAQASPFGGRVLLIGDERFGGGGVVEGDPMSEPGADGIAQGLVAEGPFIIELLNEIESVLAYEPVAVAAMPPLGQVDFVEGAPVEAGGEDGLDFGDGVEPFEDGVGLFAVVEAAIELLARRLGPLLYARSKCRSGYRIVKLSSFQFSGRSREWRGDRSRLGDGGPSFPIMRLRVGAELREDGVRQRQQEKPPPCGPQRGR